MHTLDRSRPAIAAQAVGIAQGALDYAVGYVKERKAFGHPIAEFQGLQFMLADMAMKIEAARVSPTGRAPSSTRATRTGSSTRSAPWRKHSPATRPWR